MNVVSMQILLSLGMYDLLALMLTTGVTFLTNFTISRSWVFKKQLAGATLLLIFMALPVHAEEATSTDPAAPDAFNFVPTLSTPSSSPTTTEPTEATTSVPSTTLREPVQNEVTAPLPTKQKVPTTKSSPAQKKKVPFVDTTRATTTASSTPVAVLSVLPPSNDTGDVYAYAFIPPLDRDTTRGLLVVAFACALLGIVLIERTALDRAIEHTSRVFTTRSLPQPPATERR
jgi:hypothetical protein